MENGTSLEGRLLPSRPLGMLSSGDGIVASGDASHASRGYLIARFLSEGEASFNMGRLLAQTGEYGQQPFYLAVSGDDANIIRERIYSFHLLSGEEEVNSNSEPLAWTGEYARQGLLSRFMFVQKTALTGIPDFRDIPDRRSIAEICKVIRSFASYQPGWKGEDSVAPPQAEIDNAVKFIWAIPFRVVQPKAMIGADGDVGFTWRRGDDYLEVGFAEGEMSFCCQKGGEWHRGDFPFADNIPDDLLQAIRGVAGYR